MQLLGMGFMSWLEKTDEAAKSKGNKIHTLWQFIKFLVVSLLATVIQLVLVNILYFWMKSYVEPLPNFLNAIFTSDTVGEGNNNWGYVLPFFISNFAANTVGYFLNKSKTFKSDAPMWHFILYILVLFALILFSTSVIIISELISTKSFSNLAFKSAASSKACLSSTFSVKCEAIVSANLP